MFNKKDFIVHTPQEIAGIRTAAQATAMVRERVARMINAGMTTKEVDDIAGSLIASTGGKSAFFGYHGYPAQICISVNDEVVHGIASPARVLMEGDVVSIDLGVNIGGFVGDTALTISLGEPNPDVKRLLEYTEKSLMAGITQALPGNYIADISAAIEKVAKSANLGIVRDYVGHGCGCALHEPPEIPNFVSRYRGPQLVPGMVLAIEPMLNLGTHKVFVERDKWTVRTLDGKVSAHFEHTVCITESEPEILTWLKM